MSLFRLVVREILHRRLGFFLAFLSVVIAVASLIGAMVLLRTHDARTREILADEEARLKTRMAELNEEMRKAMLELGFNVVILPKEQDLSDWYAEDYASEDMPYEYVERLRRSKIITITHLLPSLQKKIRWEEKERTVILVGTSGEVPVLHMDPKKPLVQPVADGKIVLGWQLHHDLKLKVGDPVTLQGKTFVVQACRPRAEAKDNITAWVPLAAAQEILGKQGLINAILALECKCASADLAKVTKEVTGILPDTQVVEMASRARARKRARDEASRQHKVLLDRKAQERDRLREERERSAAILVPVVMLASAVWLGFLAFGNVRERQTEIGVLRALGYRSAQIFLVFLSRAVLIGLFGGGLGFVVGYLGGRQFGAVLEHSGRKPAILFDPGMLVLALVLAPALSLVASWIPAVLAVRQDPADILRRE